MVIDLYCLFVKDFLTCCIRFLLVSLFFSSVNFHLHFVSLPAQSAETENIFFHTLTCLPVIYMPSLAQGYAEYLMIPHKFTPGRFGSTFCQLPFVHRTIISPLPDCIVLLIKSPKLNGDTPFLLPMIYPHLIWKTNQTIIIKPHQKVE